MITFRYTIIILIDKEVAKISEGILNLVQFSKKKWSRNKRRTRFIEKMNKEFIRIFLEEERVVYSKTYI